MYLGPSIRMGRAGFPGFYLSSKAIARELMAPTKLWRLILWGDSRMGSMEGYFSTNCPNLYVTGCHLYGAGDYPLTAGGGALAGQTLSYSGNNPAVSPYGLGNVTWFPGYAQESQLTGSPIGANVLSSRLFSWASSSTTHPLIWPRWAASGKDVAMRSFFYRHPGAPATSPGVKVYYRTTAANYTPPQYVSAPVTGLSTGSGLQQVSLTIPGGHDWGTYTACNSEIQGVQSAVTTLGNVLSYSRPIFEQLEAGITLLDHAVGGASIERFVDTAVYPDSLWAADGFYGWLQNPIVWIDLGTNNPFVNTQAQHEAYLRALIARWRSYYPYCPVVLSTAFQGRYHDWDAYWKLAAINVAATTPGVLLINTFDAMGTFLWMQAQGYTADDVHLTASGHVYHMTTISDLILSLAA